MSNRTVELTASLIGTPSDAATKKTQHLDGDLTATILIHQANHDGDDNLERAILSLAIDNRWRDTFESFKTHHPQATTELDELWKRTLTPVEIAVVGVTAPQQEG